MNEKNPWLKVPAADYEGHMGSPEVGQLQFLSREFQEMLAEIQPRSLLVLGCATGNGFEHLSKQNPERIVGVDVHPEYLDVLRRRYSEKLPSLQLICDDVLSCSLEPQSFDFIFAGLIFEFVDPKELLPRIASWLQPGGSLAVILQLPGETTAVTPTAFQSLQQLSSVLQLVNPRELSALAERQQLKMANERTETLPSGKQFYIGILRQTATARLAEPG